MKTLFNHPWSSWHPEFSVTGRPDGLEQRKKKTYTTAVAEGQGHLLRPRHLSPGGQSWTAGLLLSLWTPGCSAQIMSWAQPYWNKWWYWNEWWRASLGIKEWEPLGTDRKSLIRVTCCDSETQHEMLKWCHFPSPILDHPAAPFLSSRTSAAFTAWSFIAHTSTNILLLVSLDYIMVINLSVILFLAANLWSLVKCFNVITHKNMQKSFM